MKSKRRRHDAQFKARVALEALKENKTIPEICKEYDLHSTQICGWKKILVERMPSLFGKKAGLEVDESFEKERAQLHSKIGELTIAVDFLQKKSKQLGL